MWFLGLNYGERDFSTANTGYRLSPHLVSVSFRHRSDTAGRAVDMQKNGETPEKARAFMQNAG
jgi:hypothetical protein